MPQTKLEMALLARQPTTPGEAKYRDLVTNPKIDPKTGLPPVPGLFLGSPPVVGEELQRTIDRLLRVAPSLRGQLKSAVHGPNDSTMRKMIERRLPPTMFANTDLMGNAGIPGEPETYGHVAVNPQLRVKTNPKSLKRTTAHELAHVAGLDELMAQIAGGTYVEDKMPEGIQHMDFGARINDILKRK